MCMYVCQLVNIFVFNFRRDPVVGDVEVLSVIQHSLQPEEQEVDFLVLQGLMVGENQIEVHFSFVC